MAPVNTTITYDAFRIITITAPLRCVAFDCSVLLMDKVQFDSTQKID